MRHNIQKLDKKRIVVIGAGFSGLNFAKNVAHSNYQIVLLDRNNYTMFHPLFYQVATSGLEANAICYPLRKTFHRFPNVSIRITEVLGVDTASRTVQTTIGDIDYDYLVISVGTTNNFFGNQHIQENALPMKSVSEALLLRNTLLENFEKALIAETDDEREGLMNIVVVGGGPTGTELAGTLAEMKKVILPRDYPEMDFSPMKIYLVEGLPALLNTMSKASQQKAYKYLVKMGVNVMLNTLLKDYDGKHIHYGEKDTLRTDNLIWAAGVTGETVKGFIPSALVKGGRFKVGPDFLVEGYNNVYAIGDIAFMTTEKYERGHPQLASVAIQQGEALAKNFAKMVEGGKVKPFKYFDKGTMATIGRNKAVVDLPFMSFQGFFAWLTWMFVHLFLTLGIKNKLIIFVNWVWSYFTYDQSLRLIIKPKIKENRNEFFVKELN